MWCVVAIRLCDVAFTVSYQMPGVVTEMNAKVWGKGLKNQMSMVGDLT